MSVGINDGSAVGVEGVKDGDAEGTEMDTSDGDCVSFPEGAVEG